MEVHVQYTAAHEEAPCGAESLVTPFSDRAEVWRARFGEPSDRKGARALVLEQRSQRSDGSFSWLNVQGSCLLVRDDCTEEEYAEWLRRDVARIVVDGMVVHDGQAAAGAAEGGEACLRVERDVEAVAAAAAEVARAAAECEGLSSEAKCAVAKAAVLVSGEIPA